MGLWMYAKDVALERRATRAYARVSFESCRQRVILSLSRQSLAILETPVTTYHNACRTD